MERKYLPFTFSYRCAVLLMTDAIICRLIIQLFKDVPEKELEIFIDSIPRLNKGNFRSPADSRWEHLTSQMVARKINQFKKYERLRLFLGKSPSKKQIHLSMDEQNIFFLLQDKGICDFIQQIIRERKFSQRQVMTHCVKLLQADSRVREEMIKSGAMRKAAHRNIIKLAEKY